MRVSQAAKDLGLHENVLRKWVQAHGQHAGQAFHGRGKQRPDDAEVSRLRRELAKTKAERDILKKSDRLLREGTAVKFAFIAKHCGLWQTRQMCTTLEVSRAGFYEWLGRSPSARSLANHRLLVQVRTSLEQSDQTYGSPRVWRDLRAWGHACGRHRIARLMRLAGLQATCAMLLGFVNEVNAQVGKKISQATAATLTAEAQAIEAAIGCN